MKLKFDVTAQEYVLLRDILAEHLPEGVKVWVFGSRAKHTARFNSDIDLALEGKEPIGDRIIARLKDAFTDAPLPYRVDIVDMASVSDEFYSIIRKQAITFPIGDAHNMPKLRFPGFNEPLASVKLGEVASFSKGKGISKNDIAPGGALPCIRYGELYTVYDTVIDEPVSRTDVPASVLTLSKGDEVLVPASGEDAKDIATAVVVKPSGVALGGDLNIIRSKNDGAFLASYLSGRKRMTLAAMAQGNSVVHLYPAQLKTLDIHLPTLPEQRKIASFLGAVDTKIAQLAEKKRLLEDYKKGCMQQLFSQKIRFKDDDGNDFPDWEEKRLGEVLTYEQPTKYLVASSEYSDAYKTPVLTAGKTFILGYTNETEGIFNRLPTIIFDDFTTAFKFVDFPFKAKSSAMKMLSLNNKEDDIRFVYAAMLQVDFQVGEHKRYWISEYQKEFIPYPHPAEQRKIADFLSAIDRKIDLVGAELEHAKTFKKGLLQQMFV